MFSASIVDATLTVRSCGRKVSGACRGSNPQTRWWTPELTGQVPAGEASRSPDGPGGKNWVGRSGRSSVRPWRRTIGRPRRDSGKPSGASEGGSSTLPTLFTVQFEFKLLGGKALGVDEIRPEYLKSLDVVGLSWLTRLCNIAWRLGTVPLEWQTGVVVPLFKKGDRRVCSNYRGITLLSLPWEGLCQGTGEENSADSRPSDSGGTMRFFRPGRGTLDPASIPSTGCLRVYGSLPNQSTCALWIWRRHSTVSLVVFCGECSANDVVLLASSSQDLQHVLERFAAECEGCREEAGRLRISTSKSEAMVLDRKRVACPLRVGGEVLPQVEEFKYLGVLFTSEGKMKREIDRRIGAASAVMRSVYRTVVVKKELSRKAKLSIYWSVSTFPPSPMVMNFG
ncbi:hypothetical protein L3Q82_012769 [Scortum barcoo]|uniref:Uncharacterized protein n=1 Tax=Scortum barcoo TaxID=214431 RepID=A0ACB8W427_9TELE|nr:hypothetical protein L3Q82_012769 [Scortum barcoo]